MFRIADNNVRERLLRVPDLTLNKALEIARAAEATQSQLKQMQNLHEVNAVGKKKEKFFRKKEEEKKKSANGSTEQIDCKFCGRKHVPDRSKCPAYDQQCNKRGKSHHFATKRTGGSCPVVIYMPFRIWIMYKKFQMRVNLKSIQLMQLLIKSVLLKKRNAQNNCLHQSK